MISLVHQQADAIAAAFDDSVTRAERDAEKGYYAHRCLFPGMAVIPLDYGACIVVRFDLFGYEYLYVVFTETWELSRDEALTLVSEDEVASI